MGATTAPPPPPPADGGLLASAPSAVGACLLRLVLIGRMEAWSLASVPVLPRSRKARALLAVLGLAAGAPVPRPRLAALLWSRRGEAQRRGSLRQALHELGQALDEAGAPVLVAGRDVVALRQGAAWVDAVEVARAGAARRAEVLDLLGASELLTDLDGLDPAFDAWLGEQRARLRVHVLAEAEGLLSEADGPLAAAAAARRILGLDPARETAWRALMRAEAARGDRAAALAAFDACRAHIAGRHGAAPSPDTSALAEALRADPPPATAVARPPPLAPPPPERHRPAAMRGTRLGVLPLTRLGEEVPAHLPVGLAEEITAALALFRWIWVVDSASLAAGTAAAAAATAPERETAEAAAARALGVDFLLAGTVQRAAGRVRVTLRLTDLQAPACVAWTGRFDRDDGDLLALQDAVAAEVVARLDPEILLIEADRARARAGASATGDASAHDLLLRAIPAIHRLDREAFAEAGRRLAEAIAREPEHAGAHAWFAYWHLFLVGQGWAGGGGADEPRGEAAAVAEAERLAARAIALDPLDAQGLTILGHVRAFLHHRPEEALALHRRALALNPNLAAAWVFLGMAESYLGGHEAALRHLDRYRQLAPCHPHGFFFDAARGIPLLLLGRHAEAVEVGRAATALRPGCSYPYKTYLAALGHLGRAEEAAAVRARLLAVEPDFTVAKALRRTPVRRAEDRALYARGLRLAGLG